LGQISFVYSSSHVKLVAPPALPPCQPMAAALTRIPSTLG